MDWITHDEDLWFDFRGNDPHQLQPGRFYRGTVDGFAEFGVFIDLTSGVTGLLHRSELDQRLESLDWESGDTVFVQVKNVRDNGNVDLAWSKRQSESEFRGARVHDPNGDADGDRLETSETGGDVVRHTPQEGTSRTVGDSEGSSENGATDDAEADEGNGSPGPTEETSGEQAADATDDPETGADAEAAATTNDAPEPTGDAAGATDDSGSGTEAESESAPAQRAAEAADSQGAAGAASAATAASESADESADDGAADDEATDDEAADDEATDGDEAELARVSVDSLGDRVGDEVRIEGTIVGVRQTGGPTVFEVRDETGVVDCAAFVEAGVRAYPEVEVDDAVRLDGEVELRRNELQIETEELTVLDGEAGQAVTDRLEAAVTDRARPSSVEPLAPHAPVEAVTDRLVDAAEAVRRAVLESRPVVVRHAATADGYVAGAALERAVLPLVREEYATSDAEYHYFTRRPLDDPVYDMDATTNDVTRMLQDRDRHDEKLPLVVLVGTGSTVESSDGLGLLSVYDVERVVVDAAAADPDVEEQAEVVVNPELAGADADDLSTGALGAVLAATVNADVREDLAHLPAVSYWEDAPEGYLDLAREAGFDEERTRDLREAVALEAYYQSYEDKRELITDILFGGQADPDADVRSLAAHVAEQFRIKLDDELETASANLERRTEDGIEVAVLDADAYTHRYDFPPTPLLVDELHRRHREGDRFVTVVASMDELFVRATDEVDVRAIAETAREAVPEAGVTAVGVRENRIEFLSGARDAVVDAVVDAAVASLDE